MRQTISGLVTALAVVTASAAPALACGGGLFGGCSPCGAAYVSPCAQTYAPVYVPAYTYSGCNTGCGGWGYDRLADPVTQYHASPSHHQYYYVNQGPTFTGPGAFAPYPTYQDAAVSGWAYGNRYADTQYYDGAGLEGPAVYGYRAHPRSYGGYRYSVRPGVRYGYAPRLHYGYRERALRRYY
jgi:hypothetical protein